jgi:hypothetical protein
VTSLTASSPNWLIHRKRPAKSIYRRGRGAGIIAPRRSKPTGGDHGQLLAQQAQTLEEQARALREKDRAIAEQKEALGERERHIQQLLDLITLLKRKRFDPSADRIPADQLKLFDEAELEALIADVVVGKFVDALPLYRQEKTFAREGIDISRQTMAGWMIQLGEKLAPLMASMKAVLYQGRVIHIDETRLACRCSRSPGVRRPNSPACGSPAVVRPTGQSSGSSMPKPAAGRKNTVATHQKAALIGKRYAIERELLDGSPRQRCDSNTCRAGGSSRGPRQMVRASTRRGTHFYPVSFENPQLSAQRSIGGRTFLFVRFVCVRRIST